MRRPGNRALAVDAEGRRVDGAVRADRQPFARHRAARQVRQNREDLGVAEVNAALEKALNGGVRYFYGGKTSPLRIYGHILPDTVASR